MVDANGCLSTYTSHGVYYANSVQDQQDRERLESIK